MRRPDMQFDLGEICKQIEGAAPTGFTEKCAKAHIEATLAVAERLAMIIAALDNINLQLTQIAMQKQGP